MTDPNGKRRLSQEDCAPKRPGFARNRAKGLRLTSREVAAAPALIDASLPGDVSVRQTDDEVQRLSVSGVRPAPRGVRRCLAGHHAQVSLEPVHLTPLFLRGPINRFNKILCNC
jgi:hypothetical protein